MYKIRFKTFLTIMIYTVGPTAFVNTDDLVSSMHQSCEGHFSQSDLNDAIVLSPAASFMFSCNRCCNSLTWTQESNVKLTQQKHNDYNAKKLVYFIAICWAADASRSVLGQRSGPHASDGLVVLGTFWLQRGLWQRPRQLHRVSQVLLQPL